MFSIAFPSPRRGFSLGRAARAAAVALTAAGAASAAQPASAAPIPGINIAGAEFNPSGDKLGVDYRYPEPKELDYFLRKGFKLFRVPFLASRLIEGPAFAPKLRESDVAPLERLADHLARNGAILVIDSHAYGRTRFGQPIADSITTQMFAMKWRVVAERFKSRRNVAFGLMNEPAAQTPPNGPPPPMSRSPRSATRGLEISFSSPAACGRPPRTGAPAATFRRCSPWSIPPTIT